MTRTSRLALVALSALAACSVNPNKIKPTVEDLCRGSLNALGDRTQACFGYPSAWVDFILQQYSTRLNCASWSESVSAGRIAFDESAGSQCVSDIDAMTCAQLESFLNYGPLPGACGQALAGRVPVGSACAIDADCGSAAYCEATSACGGTCKAYATAGQTCYTSSPYSSTQCSPGLNCIATDTTYTTYVCRAPYQVGASCPTGGCADGLYCDWVTTSSTYQRCQPDVPLGGSCVNYPCADGLYCDQNTASATYQTCLAQKTSGPCGQWDACLRPLYQCAGASISYATPGTCRAAWEGSPCQNGYNGCVWGAYCSTGSTPPASGVAGTCTIYPGPPGTCGTYGAEYVSCLGSYCKIPSGSTGTCTPYLPLGSACSSSGAWDQCGGVQASCTNTTSGYVCTATCP